MKNLLTLILVCLTIFTSSCDTDTITPSDQVSVVTYNDLGTFSALSVETDFKVFLTNSTGPETIEVEANENLQDKIEIVVVDNRLRIGFSESINIRGQETLNIRINTRSVVQNFQASTDAEITLLTPLNQDFISLWIVTDAKFFGEINVERLQLNITTDAVVDVFGTATNVEGELHTDAIVRSFDLETGHLDVELTTDAEAEFTVTETLDVSAITDATLTYRGDPEILRQSTNTGGRVIRD